MQTELDLYVQTLEAETVNQAYSELSYLATQAQVPVIEQVNASYSTEICDVKPTLQTMERNFDALNAVVESIYWEQSKTVGVYFRLEDYQRWVNMLRDLFDIIINGKGQWGILQLSDGIPTIDGKSIIMRGEQFG